MDSFDEDDAIDDSQEIADDYVTVVPPARQSSSSSSSRQRWDELEIDEEPVFAEDDVDDDAPVAGPLENLAANGEQEFLNYTARKNKCAAGMERTKFVQMTNIDDLKNLRPDERPYFYQVCVTVLPHEMTEGYTFGNLNYQDHAGRVKAITLALLISAYCNPSHGSFTDYDDPFDIPKESYYFYVESLNRYFCKTYVVMETLFRQRYTVNEQGESVKMKIHQMFESKNVTGYRMWFMIADPQLCPTRAIIQQINSNISQMGLGARARRVSRYTPAILNYAQEVATSKAPPDADIQQIATEAQRLCTEEAAKINLKVAKYNRDLRQNAKDFQKDFENTNGKDIRRVALEIKSLLEFYNNLICYEERCLEPNCENIMCPKCTAKKSVEDAYLTDTQVHHDPARRYDEWFAALSSICYRPIPVASEIGVTLNACLSSPEKRSNVLQILDPCFHFNMNNSTTQALCTMRGIGVYSKQLDVKQYYGVDSQGRRVFTPPFDFGMFVYTPDVVAHPKFFELRMPWCIDLRDFEITAIECYAKTQKHRLENRHSRKFFQTIDPDGVQAVEAAAVSEYWRRFISTSIPAHLSGGEYDVSHDKTAATMMPSRQEQEDLDNCVYKVVDVFDREGQRFRHYVKRLRDSMHCLSAKDIQHVTRTIREEGRRVFASVFRTSEENTSIAKEAINCLADLSRNDKSAFHEIPVVSSNMDSTFGNYLIQQYAMAEAAGLLHTHTLFLRLRWAVMRASHCHHTDSFFNQVTLLLNECFFGVAGAGKTYSAKVALEFLLARSIQIISSSSGASFADVKSGNDKMKMYDEMRPAVCPGKRGDAHDEAHLDQLKEQMTSHESRRRVTQLGKSSSTGVSDIKDRRVYELLSEDHSAIGLFGNDAITFGREDSYWTRFTIHIITKRAERCGSSDISSQAARTGGSISDTIRSPHAERKKWSKVEHALHLAIARQIRVGALPYVNLDVLNYMWNLAYKALKAVFPSISSNTRAAERITSLTLVLVISHAIYLVFNSLWSPLIHFDVDNQKITHDAYNHDHLRLIAPHLCANEDIAIYAITSGLFLDFCPPEHYFIAKSAAEVFGMIDTMTPQYTILRYNNQDYPNPNYVNCGTGNQLIRHIEDKFGHNRYTAMHVINLLSKTKVVVDFINPAMPAQPPTKKEINVLTLVNNQEQTSSTPEGTMALSTVHISVEYVRKWTPNNVLNLVIDAMSHNKIQERQVVIGQTIKKFPFLPNVVNLKRGTHSVNLSTFTETSSYITDALVGGYSVTREATEHRDRINSADVPVISVGQDPETFLTVRWLKENVEIPEDVPPQFYTRAYIEKTIRKRIQEWFPTTHGCKNYPSDIMRAYQTSDDASTTTENYFEEDFVRAAPQPKERRSSSSSSSSTSSKVSNLCASFVSSKRSTPEQVDTRLPLSASQKRPCVRPAL